jgi:hypothetical protein
MTLTKKPQKLRRITVPLAGAITLAVATLLIFPSGEAGIPVFILMFMIGGLLSMLVGWPVLWLTERYLQTPLRYIAAGMFTGLLIWVGCVLPNIIEAFTATAVKPFVQPRYFKEGAVVFVVIGAVAGAAAVMIDRVIGMIARAR